MRVVTEGIRYAVYSPTNGCFWTGRGWEAEIRLAGLYEKRSVAERLIAKIKDSGEKAPMTPVTVSLFAYGVNARTGAIAADGVTTEQAHRDDDK